MSNTHDPAKPSPLSNTQQQNEHLTLNLENGTASPCQPFSQANRPRRRSTRLRRLQEIRSQKSERRSTPLGNSPKKIRTISTGKVEPGKSFFANSQQGRHCKYLQQGQKPKEERANRSPGMCLLKSDSKKQVRRILSGRDFSSFNEGISQEQFQAEQVKDKAKAKLARKAHFEQMKMNLSSILKKINNEYENQILKNRRRWTPQSDNRLSKNLHQTYKRAPKSDMNNPSSEHTPDKNAFNFAQRAEPRGGSQDLPSGSHIVNPGQIRDDVQHGNEIHNVGPHGGQGEPAPRREAPGGGELNERQDLVRGDIQNGNEFRSRVDPRLGGKNESHPGWQGGQGGLRQQAPLMSREGDTGERVRPQRVMNEGEATMGEFTHQNYAQEVLSQGTATQNPQMHYPSQGRTNQNPINRTHGHGVPQIASQQMDQRNTHPDPYGHLNSGANPTLENQPTNLENPISPNQHQPARNLETISPMTQMQAKDQRPPNRHETVQSMMYQNTAKQGASEMLHTNQAPQTINRANPQNLTPVEAQIPAPNQNQIQPIHSQADPTQMNPQSYEASHGQHPHLQHPTSQQQYLASQNLRQQKEQAYLRIQHLQERDKQNQLQQDQLRARYPQQMMANYQNPQNLNTNIPEYPRPEQGMSEQQKILEQYTQMCNRVLNGPYQFKTHENKLYVDFGGNIYDIESIKARDLEIRTQSKAKEYQQQQQIAIAQAQAQAQAEREPYAQNPQMVNAHYGQGNVAPQAYPPNYGAYPVQAYPQNATQYNEGQYFRNPFLPLDITLYLLS